MADKTAEAPTDMAATLAELGVEFVTEDLVPAPSKTRVRDPRWAILADYLPSVPGQWTRAKIFDNSGAATTAANINANKSKVFPSEKFEARNESVKNADGKNTGQSVLYLRAR